MSWKETFPSEIHLEQLIHNKWKPIFEKVNVKQIEEELFKEVRMTEIYPPAQDVFSTFNNLCPEQVKVVIIGQDPYINENEAMGMAFSVKNGVKIPPSLRNIFNNLLKFKHISELPSNGDLTNWNKQGVLLLNSALTVRKGQSNSHEDMWINFTNEIIKYISSNNERVVFVLWGMNAISKEQFINVNKHVIIKSSHPSPFSCKRRILSRTPNIPSFEETDHFGMINKYYKINW
jgi:uracil-DNA glycosylase